MIFLCIHTIIEFNISSQNALLGMDALCSHESWRKWERWTEFEARCGCGRRTWAGLYTAGGVDHRVASEGAVWRVPLPGIFHFSVQMSHALACATCFPIFFLAFYAWKYFKSYIFSTSPNLWHCQTFVSNRGWTSSQASSEPWST